jgi:pumilio RNA-binding family
VQRCLEAASVPDERRKIVSCMRFVHVVVISSFSHLINISRGRIVKLEMNCYRCHVLQKALDCEEDIRLLIVSGRIGFQNLISKLIEL